MKQKLQEATYGEVRQQKYDIAILPWGATEPHNYHLPYLTDCYLAEAIALDAASQAAEKGVHCMVLPPIPFGAQNPGQHDYPFCIHTRHSTQFAILSDITASLYRQGFRKLLIVNGHGGNSFKSMIRDLSFDYPEFKILVADWFAIIPEQSYFENKDDHAGEMETSVLMHYHPELVDLSTAGDGKAIPFNIDTLNRKIAWTPRIWNKTTADTGVGDPSKSTAEKGGRYARAVTGELAELLVEFAQNELYQI